MAGEPITVVVQSRGPGVADLLDEARSLVHELELRGYRPDEVAIHRAPYDAIMNAKHDEVTRGQQVFLLGLDIVVIDEATESTP
ncbi:MAG: hypothetical protein AB7Q27_01175 [Acidimicrobiia bacterium]